MERKLLQIAFALAGLALVGFGLGGVFFGPHAVPISSATAIVDTTYLASLMENSYLLSICCIRSISVD